MPLIKCMRCDREFAAGFHDCKDLCDSCTDPAYQRGRADERAAIVAWLNDLGQDEHPLNCPLTSAAKHISRADHLRPDIKDGEGEQP